MPVHLVAPKKQVQVLHFQHVRHLMLHAQSMLLELPVLLNKLLVQDTQQLQVQIVYKLHQLHYVYGTLQEQLHVNQFQLQQIVP